MIEGKIKCFIAEFNNLCRIDNEIKEWCILKIEEDELQIDVNFIDIFENIYKYHHRIDISVFNNYFNSKDEIYYYAFDCFSKLKNYYAKERIKGNEENN